MPEGTLVGTPSYMSPEQARGSGQVDASTDQYSLGASLYEMLTGEPPFRGTPAMVVHQVLGEEPRPPRRLSEAIPRDLETICLKTLAKDPRQRYPRRGRPGRRPVALAARRADHGDDPSDRSADWCAGPRGTGVSPR